MSDFPTFRRRVHLAVALVAVIGSGLVVFGYLTDNGWNTLLPTLLLAVSMVVLGWWKEIRRIKDRPR